MLVSSLNRRRDACCHDDGWVLPCSTAAKVVDELSLSCIRHPLSTPNLRRDDARCNDDEVVYFSFVVTVAVVVDESNEEKLLTVDAARRIEGMLFAVVRSADCQ